MIKLDILSDPICPWCYIGKTNLDRALQTAPDHPFVIEWHPFQLNPDMPADGMDRREYLERKFGGQKGAIEVYGQIDEAAKKIGLEINWQGIIKTPNTFEAHRLIHWAGIEGRQTVIVAAIFEAYFMNGQDIGHIDVLLEIAGECGMDPDATQRLFASEVDSDALRTREAHSREMGVTSVPTFIVANQAVVQGAQGQELWLDVLKDLSSETVDS